MRTYTHGIIGYLLYVRSSRQQKLLAIIGAMIPDTFLVIGFIFDYLGNSAIVESMHHFFFIVLFCISLQRRCILLCSSSHY